MTIILSAENTKEQFSSELDTIMAWTPASNKLILLGDFNVRVGRDCNNWN